MAKSTTYMEEDILEELDLAFNGLPSRYYPQKEINDIQYTFFLDLEHGYMETAGNQIHLYADSARWAIVFEKSGYHSRAGKAFVELDFIGNCIHYITKNQNGKNYVSNTKNICLIPYSEYERIRNRKGPDMEQFELISDSVKSIKVRDKVISIESNLRLFQEMGVSREFENPRHLLSYGGLIRYLYETNPSVIQSTEVDIRTQLPPHIPRIMTLDKFHYTSCYDEDIPPSKQELFQLIAKVLVLKDSTFWKPRKKPNNHWSNWESGNL